jgi:hypothetical protein
MAASPDAPRARLLVVVLPLVAAVLAACGAGQHHPAGRPPTRYTVAVPTAKFARLQHVAMPTHLVIRVRNTSPQAIPNISVTICNVTCSSGAGESTGTSAGPFATELNAPDLASRSRPAWIVDRPPGPCGYSCAAGGPGASVTTEPNTWALGALRPGATATFEWSLTPVAPGRYLIAYEVAGSLDPGSHTALRDGSAARGTFKVTISAAPPKQSVNSSGQIVKTAE